MRPSGWRQTSLGDCAQFINGRAYKQTELLRSGTPVIRIQNLKGGNDWYFSDLTLPDHQYCENGDLLFAWSATFGPFKWLGPKSIYHYHIWKVVPKRGLDQMFAFHMLEHLTSSIKARSHGGLGMLHMTKAGIEAWPVDLPPLPEQKKIAAILGSVDNAIQATQAVIDQTRKLKHGLLQQLLTRGIGHTRFKQTEIGEIPEDWQVVTLADVSEYVTSGSRGWAQYYATDGALFLRITNLQRGSVAIDLTDLQHVKLPVGSTEGTRSKVHPGDVLISITADLGIIGLVPPGGLGEAYVNQHIALVRPRESGVSPAFLANFLTADSAQKQFQASNDSGAKAGLNLVSIRAVRLALPPMAEQQTIAEAIARHDTFINSEIQKLSALRSTKDGLMADLLSGRKRVEVSA